MEKVNEAMLQPTAKIKNALWISFNVKLWILFLWLWSQWCKEGQSLLRQYSVSPLSIICKIL